ncbi:WD40 repeat domain-containing protein [Nocardia sp. CDC153]|uniref:WD40 repeat domain-containing protein n=1 Tax=Nocardia sp. CDC153 TaxID=3112167 RepID=UPI002DBD397A|nr:WD40 repeat domain-containing protein [Nocardia sp. CDC153]MEC3954911.1 WD40 repeat domain-containing protein [Nocardia sp. CDC153]
MTEDDQIGSPRALFARRFAELYEAAGNPTLRRVATAAENRMRAAQGTRPGGASAQRISDWKAGRNVPARFESLLPVVLTLIDLARKSGRPLPRHLADPKEWQRLWQSATTWNPDADSEPPCPYPGLTAYDGHNRTLFFGRTRATTELTDLVRTATGIVVLIGASGAGKSSLLAAGLIPALPDWETTLFTPGADPLAALRRAIAETTNATAAAAEHTAAKSADPITKPADHPDADSTDRAATEQSGRAVADAVDVESDSAAEPTALAPRVDGPRRLLVIDQAEELFTTCGSDREREDFLALLNTCATRADDPIAVVLALRADFYAHCLDHLVLQDALEHRSYLLGPMRTDELAQAISGPARAAGLELEPGLEELVITELCGAGDHHGRRTYDPGALPLLSHVMAATWQHREGRRLTTTGYRKAGGVVGSVAETAEHAWNELSPAQQSAARDLLLGLVTVRRDARDTRRPALRSDLLARAANPADATAALELLSHTRLITLDADAVTLTHEIVLTAWPRLRTWIDEDRVGYLVRQRLESDAAEWAAQHRDPSLLYRGTRLRNALDNVDPPPVGPLAHEFLAAADAASRKSRNRSRRTTGILAILGVGLLVLAFGVYSQNRLADQRRDDKNFAAVLAQADRVHQTDPSLAAQLNLIAWRMRPGDNDVRSRLLQSQIDPLVTVTSAHPQQVVQLAYQPNAKVLVSLASDRGLRLWDSTDTRHPRQLGKQLDRVDGVAVGPANLMATTAVQEAPGTVTLWDIADPAIPRQLATLPNLPESGPLRTAFTADGHTLAVETRTHLMLWSVGDPRAPVLTAMRTLPASGGAPGEIRFSPDGRLLALVALDLTANTAAVQLWNVANPANPTLLTPALDAPAELVLAIDFSPDSTMLAVGSSEETRVSDDSAIGVRLWDVRDAAHTRPLATLDTGSRLLRALVFSPQGDTLAVSGNRGSSVWNITDPANPTRLIDQLPMSPSLCHFGQLSSQCIGGPDTLAFAPDGRTLAAGGYSGDIQIWSLPSAVLAEPVGAGPSPAYAANGNRLANVTGSGRVVLWDVRDPTLPTRIGEYRAESVTPAVRLSADGNTLLVFDMLSARVRTVDLTDPAHPRTLGDWTLATPKSQRIATISRSNRLMATVGSDSFQLWDLSDSTRPQPIGTPRPLGESGSAFFGADDSTLILYRMPGEQGRQQLIAELWNITDPTRPQLVSELLNRPATVIDTVGITPDQKTLVDTSNERIQLWDITAPSKPVRLGDPFTAHTVPIVPFVSTDPRTLFTVGVDGTLQRWDLSDRAHPKLITALAQSVSYSWNAALAPDRRHIASASTDGTLHLWDLDEQHAVDRICALTGTMWTEDLWHRYLPQLPYHPPCPA